jgi:NADH dehydrogenase [ubiquinone] 1 alpha subcomplex assembly factor 7
MTVHDYMQLCLQHPEHGYYRKAQAVGAEGDFITAPEISQIFGDLIGMWLIHAWQVSGAPKKAALVEFGPGRGTLSADVFRILKKNKDAAEVFSLHLLESNETLRVEQSKKLWHYQPQWCDALEDLPTDRPLFILANEFFDALPIRQFFGMQERCITLKNGELAFENDNPVTHETCPQAEDTIRDVAARLKAQGGGMLAIDYGYATLPMPTHGEPSCDTLQAIKNHAYHPVLQDAGEADLTAHVNFGRLAEVATEAGLQVHGITEQGAFLQRIGGEIWLHKLLLSATPNKQKELQQGWLRLASPAQMGSLFKVMALTPQPCELAGLR